MPGVRSHRLAGPGSRTDLAASAPDHPVWGWDQKVTARARGAAALTGPAPLPLPQAQAPSPPARHPPPPGSAHGRPQLLPRALGPPQAPAGLCWPPVPARRLPHSGPHRAPHPPHLPSPSCPRSLAAMRRRAALQPRLGPARRAAAAARRLTRRAWPGKPPSRQGPHYRAPQLQGPRPARWGPRPRPTRHDHPGKATQ